MSNIIFIFSMPRSGSTLLQKILMGHKNISSCSEPWFLLNLASLQDYENISSDFSFETLRTAVNDLILKLDNREQDFYGYIREFSLNIYGNLSDESSIYFIDKTPRYFLIIDFIQKVFPSSKFIFLTRNPASIVTSYIASFNSNTLKNFDNYDLDFTVGFENLSRGYAKYKEKSILVRYEDLVGGDNRQVIEKIFNYLDLKCDSSVLSNYFSQKLDGSFGDKNIDSLSGIANFEDKWKQVVNSRTRKSLLLNLIKSIDQGYLEMSEFDREKLVTDISVLPVRICFSDYRDYVEAILRRRIKRLIGWKSYS